MFELAVGFDELGLLDALWGRAREAGLRLDDLGAWGLFCEWLSGAIGRGEVEPRLEAVGELLADRFGEVWAELGL